MDLEERDAWLQERYARWLDWSTRIALAVLLCAFLLYISGLVPAYVPLENQPQLWQLPLAQYLERTGAPIGWQWLGLIAYGDYLTYVGICLFAVVVLVCDLAIIAPLLRNGEWLLAGLAIAQVAVLLFAASGLFAGG